MKPSSKDDDDDDDVHTHTPTAKTRNVPGRTAQSSQYLLGLIFMILRDDAQRAEVGRGVGDQRQPVRETCHEGQERWHVSTL